MQVLPLQYYITAVLALGQIEMALWCAESYYVLFSRLCFLFLVLGPAGHCKPRGRSRLYGPSVKYLTTPSAGISTTPPLTPLDPNSNPNFCLCQVF